MQQIQETVKNVMRDNGMTPPDVIITDGQLHRFKDESGKLNSYFTTTFKAMLIKINSWARCLGVFL